MCKQTATSLWIGGLFLLYLNLRKIFYSAATFLLAAVFELPIRPLIGVQACVQHGSNVITADEGAINHDYLATHEIASAQIEEVFFDHLNEVRSTKPLGSPYDFECALLNGSDPETRIGTALVLQVMAGDKIKMSGYSYHEGKGEEDIFTQPEYMLSSILSSLTGSGYNIGQGEMEDNSEILGSLFSSENYMNAYEDIKGGMTNPDDPRAFLNYLVFDGEMNLVPEQSGVNGLFYQGVNTYGTGYGLGLGSINIYFMRGSDLGRPSLGMVPVGFSDYYNFDAQNRSFFAEQSTTFGRAFKGIPYNIRFFITPPQSYIDKHYKR